MREEKLGKESGILSGCGLTSAGSEVKGVKLSLNTSPTCQGRQIGHRTQNSKLLVSECLVSTSGLGLTDRLQVSILSTLSETGTWGEHTSSWKVQAREASAASPTSGPVCNLTSNPRAPKETAAEGLEEDAEPRNCPESGWSHIACSRAGNTWPVCASDSPLLTPQSVQERECVLGTCNCDRPSFLPGKHLSEYWTQNSRDWPMLLSSSFHRREAKQGPATAMQALAPPQKGCSSLRT